MNDYITNKYKRINMISLGIKNKMFTYFARLVNILDFNPKKLSIQKVGTNDLGIYYIDYDKSPIYVVIDDLKGYFEKNDGNGNKYLTIIFKDEKPKMIDTRIWEEIKKLINDSNDNKFDDYSKDYGIISFDTDEILQFNSTIDIHSLTIIIRSAFKNDSNFHSQIYLNHCSYDNV